MKELEDKSADLAEDPDLMERLDQAFDQQGLVGEDKNARLGYLAATARLFKRPTNLAFKGQSSTGKSNLLDAILNLLPETAYFNYTTVSQKYLAYTRDNLSHAIVVIYEARGMGDDEALAYMVRSLLSEGQVVVGTVVRDDEGDFVAQKVVKPGPTALFTTSTLPELDADMETRLLSPQVDESVEQTQRIVLSAAREYESATERVVADREAFIALQLWLEHCGKRRVVIPYASAVAKKLATEALRVRRDVHKLFTLVAASALLHQRQRSEVHDAVVATIRDYEIVYPLLADTMTASQQGGLTERLRAVVAVVQDVCAKNPEAKTTGVNVSTIARALKLNTSTVWRRVEVLEREGYLRNLEERPRRPARLVLGEELPAPNSAMPHPSEIVEEGEL
jgi:uncharacterized protein YerC